MIYWGFFNEICVNTYSVIPTICKWKMQLTSKKIHIFKEYKKFGVYTHFPKIYTERLQKTLSHSPMEIKCGIATCIVIVHLKIVFVNTYTYLKQCMSYILMYKSLMY